MEKEETGHQGSVGDTNLQKVLVVGSHGTVTSTCKRIAEILKKEGYAVIGHNELHTGVALQVDDQSRRVKETVADLAREFFDQEVMKDVWLEDDNKPIKNDAYRQFLPRRSRRW